jgi:hypothetical protein
MARQISVIDIVRLTIPVVMSVVAFSAFSGARADVMNPGPGGSGMPAPIALTGAVASGITVQGHAEMKVKADIATATLDIATDERDETAAVQNNAIKVQEVVTALLKSGVEQKDIQTDSYTVSPDYAQNTNPPLITGYTVDNSVDVTIRNVAKAGLILDKATAVGATSDGLSFDLADRSKAQGEVLVDAVANARSKADLIAGAAGVAVGRVLSISEQGAQSPPPMFAAMGRMSAMASAPPSTPISSQDIEIAADVTATFAIDYTTH